MKRIPAFLRIAVVLLVAFPALGAVHVELSGDVNASVSGVSGDTVTILVTNSAPETTGVEVTLTVRLDDNSTETLTTGGLYLDPNQTAYVEIQASRTVSEILDGPDPFPI
jgi:hypothetical protein